MGMGDHPPGGNGVEHAAVRGVEPRALAARHQGCVRCQRMLGEGVPDRRTHVKSRAAKLSANTLFNWAEVNGWMMGNRPRRFTVPISAMMDSLSVLASPMKATPCKGILRRRIASIANRL